MADGDSGAPHTGERTARMDDARLGGDSQEPMGRADAVQAPGGPGAGACMPCRGTGKVISNLGGSSSEVTCPWCHGTGMRTPGIDAQEPWAKQGAP